MFSGEQSTGGAGRFRTGLSPPGCPEDSSRKPHCSELNFHTIVTLSGYTLTHCLQIEALFPLLSFKVLATASFFRLDKLHDTDSSICPTSRGGMNHSPAPWQFRFAIIQETPARPASLPTGDAAGFTPNPQTRNGLYIERDGPPT